MNIDPVQVVRLDDHPDLSLAELAGISGLSEQELANLVDFGVITPVDSGTAVPMFRAQWIVTTRSAFRLRCAFDLDNQGLAITLTLLQRVEELEDQLTQARAWLPRAGLRRRA